MWYCRVRRVSPAHQELLDHLEPTEDQDLKVSLDLREMLANRYVQLTLHVHVMLSVTCVLLVTIVD